MRGDLETLYDAHAHRLYSHCWSLLGDHGAAEALSDTLTEAVRHPPHGETVLWLHHLTRKVCAERGAFGRHGRAAFAEAAGDPLLTAAADLPAAHREALLLSAGEWLDVRDIARVRRLSPDAVRELLHEARTTLERFVLNALMRHTTDAAEHMDVIEAFEKGRLPHLLARRAPAWAPAPLRDQVLEAAERDETGAAPVGPAVPAGQLVVIDSGAAPPADPRRERSRRRRAALRSVGGVAGVAASITVGLLLTWPSTDQGTVNALGSPDGGTRHSGPVPAGPDTPEGPGDKPGDGPQNTAPAPKPTAKKRASIAAEPTSTGGGASRLEKSTQRDTPPALPDTPPASRQSPAPPAQDPPPAPQQEQPQQQDDGANQDGLLSPVTDIVGSVTSPLLGGLTGQQ